MNNNIIKLKIIKAFLWVTGVFLLLWWPISHWFYSDFYHTLLGFELGSYQENMVRIIGTCGFLPVILIFLAQRNPIGNKDIILGIIIFSLLMAITYIYLIISGQFPQREYINIAICIFTSVFLVIFYPWNFEIKK